jgi:hypothetical protein
LKHATNHIQQRYHQFKKNIMNITIIFSLVFTAQILGLSFLLPRFLLQRIEKVNKDLLIMNSTIKRYRMLNNINILVGFLVLSLISFHSVFSSIELSLLIIGIYFLLQISPIIISKKLLEISESYEPDNQRKIKLTTVVHPLAIGIALILFLSYLIKLFIEWDGTVNTQLLQMIIFSCVNTFLVGILIFIYRKINRTSGEERQELKVGFSKSAPLFIYLSIGISIYHFAKILIFNFDLNEFRPVMMCIALIAVGLAIYSTIMPNNHMLVNSQEE